jgi:rhodanese-related sulfurtransferase
MAEFGFKNIYNMSGGMRDWQALGYPLVR